MARKTHFSFLDQVLLLPCNVGQAVPCSVQICARAWLSPGSWGARAPTRCPGWFSHSLQHCVGSCWPPCSGRPIVAESSSSAGHARTCVRFSFTRRQRAYGASTGHATLPVGCGLPGTGACSKSCESTGQDVLTQARRLWFACSIHIPRASQASPGRNDEEPREVL